MHKGNTQDTITIIIKPDSEPMAKLKPRFTMKSYGIYTQWEEKSKDLPKLIEVTTDVPSREDIEFGFVINAKSAKGCELKFTIYHPDIKDKHGDVMAPFTGEVYIRNNDWDFYLGDTIWLPLNDKVGHWRMTLEHDNKVIAEKTFLVEVEFKGERTIGAARTSFKPKKRW